MEKANMAVRLAAKEKGIPLWMVADKLGIHYTTLSIKLRHELSDADRERYLKAIDEAAKEMKRGDIDA